MIPKTLYLGSGSRFQEHYLNADILERVNPDWVVDISNVEWNSLVDTRFGQFSVQTEIFEKIIAQDVLEHIPDLVSAMENCRDLLCDGGEVEIQVPYDLSYGAWQDPTHIRAFNENSWLYYTDWAEKQLGWSDKFELTKLVFLVSEYGHSLQDKDLTKIPRAIDSMIVTLKKIKIK